MLCVDASSGYALYSWRARFELALDGLPKFELMHKEQGQVAGASMPNIVRQV